MRTRLALISTNISARIHTLARPGLRGAESPVAHITRAHTGAGAHHAHAGMFNIFDQSRTESQTRGASFTTTAPSHSARVNNAGAGSTASSARASDSRRRANAVPLITIGTVVELHGLRDELTNGARGQVVDTAPRTEGRVLVRLTANARTPETRVVSVKPVNLRV